jgi:Fatty acid desaturase
MITVGVVAREINIGALVRVRSHRFQWKAIAAAIVSIILWWAVLSTSGIVSFIPMFLLGLMYAHCVELQHQCLHHTAYRSTRWNRFVGVLLGLPTLVSFSDYQCSHMKHHRLLGTPEDKEFFNYDYEALTTLRYFIPHLFMFPHHRNVAHSIFSSIRGRPTRDDCNPKMAGRIRTEYQIMAVMLLAMVGITIGFQTLIFVKLWLIPLLIAIPTHALIELPEHFGCQEKTPDVLKNTRTISAGKVAVWFTNGNNYHVEHHWLPSVPNDRFPDLHQSLSTEIEYLERSYWSFFRKFFKHLLGSGTRITWATEPERQEVLMTQAIEINKVIDQVFDIDQERCIRCASCSSIAPTVFYVGDSLATILRQPLDSVELDQCEAALANCPTSAITVSTNSSLT